jgi:hypothetical protein
MNAAVQAYEPTLEDTFFIIPSGDYQRLIFVGLPLRDREETHLQDFRNFLKTKNLTLPAGYDDDNRLVLRFLQKLHWDYQKAFDAIQEHCKWQLTVNVTDISPVKKDLEAGWLYAYKRDKSMRPVMIVNCRAIINAKVTIQQCVNVTDFFIHYLIKHGMVPGKVENWTAIFDLRDVGVTELPSKHISSLVRSMSQNYCGRMFKFLCTDCNWLVRSMMWTVHQFVDEFTKRKLLTFSDDYRPTLHEIVSVDHLEEKYGGTLPNKTGDFWPP